MDSFPVVQGNGFDAGAMVWKGIIMGVFEAGARPSLIAAMGSG